MRRSRRFDLHADREFEVFHEAGHRSFESEGSTDVPPQGIAFADFAARVRGKGDRTGKVHRADPQTDLGSRLASIRRNLAAFDDHIGVGVHVDLAAAFHGDVFSLDGDAAIFLHRNARISRPDDDLIARLYHEFLGYRQIVVLADIGLSILRTADFLVFATRIPAVA